MPLTIHLADVSLAAPLPPQGPHSPRPMGAAEGEERKGSGYSEPLNWPAWSLWGTVNKLCGKSPAWLPSARQRLWWVRVGKDPFVFFLN